MRDSQCAEPSRHPSGATLPFKEGKAEVAPTEHYNAIAGNVISNRRVLPAEQEKFFGYSAPLKGELSGRSPD